MQFKAATIFLMVSVASFFHNYSEGYIIYLTNRGKAPSTYQPKSQPSWRINNNSPYSTINSIISNDLVVPTSPSAPTPAYYRQQQRQEQPSTSLVRFFDDFDREFRDFYNDFSLDTPRLSRGFPSISSTSIDIDVKETPKEYVISADVPGVSKSDIEVTVEKGGILEISAVRKSDEKTSDDSKYKRQERYYGKTARAMQLPDDCDEDNIKAKYQNGVLELHIPKVQKVEQKPKVKKIDITAIKTVPESTMNPSSTSIDTTFPSSPTPAGKEQPGGTVIASRVGIVGDTNNEELSITEDEKLPTDGPTQETPTNGPTLVHDSYA